MSISKFPALLGVLMLGACAASPPARKPAASATSTQSSASNDAKSTMLTPMRVSGPIGSMTTRPRPGTSYGTQEASTRNDPKALSNAEGDISLDFADTDIRAVVAQILGSLLHVNYTIDPDVHGKATLRTVRPLARAALIPTLQTLLAQNNAVLVKANGVYRIMPAGVAANTPTLAANGSLGGTVVVKLHYTSSTQLAAVLRPYVTKGGRIVAAPSQNSLIIAGNPTTRRALIDLVHAFDVDELAGQSYELFPVTNGDAQDFAHAFSAALVRDATNAKDNHAVTIVPLKRIDAVLVIARARSYLADAARVYHMIQKVQRETVRSWHVYYLRNSRASDAAYMLQEAFTPDNVTAQPTRATSSRNSTAMMHAGGFGNGTATQGARGIGGLLGSDVTTASTSSQTPSGNTSSTAKSANTPQGSLSGASALLGPLSQDGTNTKANGIRIIPDIRNNAIFVYATPQEDGQVAGMLHKIDIMPLEVRIDATIAEVDLTGELQYGTQFFFKSGDINAVLSNATSAALSTNFPGFVLSGAGGDAAPLAISALQSVTKVHVLSSPELMVLDGHPASLQVGDLVPYLTQTSQDTTTAGAPIVNSINYRETGVIMRVTPHVGSDGLVTLDIAQEVSGVAPTVTTSGINSPTFTERAVTSRVAIQDGQTVGLAGLISDNDSHQNQGLPFLKNVPLLGDLFGTQKNNRTREELLVLITPHVIRNQQQALDLTADMRQELSRAAGVPALLRTTPVGGSADPDQKLRSRLLQ